MPVKKLKEFLDSQQVKYVTFTHSPAYTAQEIAASAHVRGKELAKTVMVTLDGKLAMAVLPASRKVSFDLLREAAGAENVQLASEQAFRDLFPGCEVGGMPPVRQPLRHGSVRLEAVGRRRGDRLQRRLAHRVDPIGVPRFPAAGQANGGPNRLRGIALWSGYW